MSATTLAIVNAPTLQRGLGELLRLADAIQEAELVGAGVWVQRDQDGHLVSVEADYDVPAGVLETSLPARPSLDPWAVPAVVVEARRELVEVLAQLNPSRDLLATAQSVGYLG